MLTGPKLFKELKAKTNINLIRNAITYSCLPGKVNDGKRKKVINVSFYFKNLSALLLTLLVKIMATFCKF